MILILIFLHNKINELWNEKKGAHIRNLDQRMEIMKVHMILMERDLELEVVNGIMDDILKGNGKMASEKEKENSYQKMVIHMMAISKMI